MKEKLLFKKGDKVTYNNCMFTIVGFSHIKQRYVCKGGLFISFTSQYSWSLVK